MTESPVIPRLVARSQEKMRTISGWGWAMFALAFAHALWMSWLQVDTHLGLGTFAYDVGLYDQGIWLLSRGEAPFVTLMGRNLLGDHASLILFLVVPFFWIVPGTATLLVIQAFVIAAGAIPTYLFTRRVLGSGAMGFAAAFLWLANPAVNGTGMENFHPDSFLGLFIPLALYAAFAEKWRLFAAAVVLAVLVKEDVLLVMVPLGLYVAWKFDRKRGLIAAGVSIIATILGMFVLMRSLIGVPTRNEWRIPFGGVSGFIKETFTNPVAVIRHLFSGDRPLYLFQMSAPFAGLFLLSPSLMLVSIPVILSNIVSTFWYQQSIQYHYSLVAVPALLFATVLAIRSLGPRFGRFAMLVTCCFTLVTSYSWGQHSLAAEPRATLGAQAPIAVSAREIITSIPDDAVISVFDPLVTFLAHRKEVYFFPNPFRALYYGVDGSLEGTRLPAADRVEYVVLPRNLNDELRWDWSLVSSDFVEIDSNEFWQVFRRK
ncbi:MAG: hypothetical protein RIR69_541 [Actinomycetota bacterium]|jgi:uncharacterized membrane protein